MSYHHGNLKETLVDAYLHLLLKMPPEEISLRKLANHVGVSFTAVYNHFADKNALKIEVRIQLLHHFANYLDKSCEDISDPKANFILLGKTYFRYSQEFPDYFRIIFQQPVPVDAPPAELITAGMRAEARVRQAATQLLEHHHISVTKHNEGLCSFACWALAHGVTTLALAYMNRAACGIERWPKQFMLDNDAAVNQSFDELFTILIMGITRFHGEQQLQA